MTLYSSGLFSVRTASGCIDNAFALPVSPSLPGGKTLAFGTTIHFVRGSKLISLKGHKNYLQHIDLNRFSELVWFYRHNNFFFRFF